MALGSALMAAGAFGFLYMLVSVVEPIKLFFWAIPVTVFIAGAAILYDDLKGG